jgi:hypothetical protein
MEVVREGVGVRGGVSVGEVECVVVNDPLIDWLAVTVAVMETVGEVSSD